MPFHSDDLALRVAFFVGEAIGQRISDVSTTDAIMAAVAAARETAELPDKVYAHARMIAGRLLHRALADTGRMAQSAILSARDLADLPDELAARSQMIIEEIGFEASDALAVVDWLESRDKAVVGIEIFYPDKDPLKIQAFGTSKSWDTVAKSSDWRATVTAYAREARDYIEVWRDFAVPDFMRIPNAALIFELFWMSEDEYRAPRDGVS